MGFERFRLKLGMELAANEVRMLGDFHHFHVRSVWCRSREAQSACGQRPFVFAIEFVAVPMAFADLGLAVNSMCQGAGLYLARPCAQPHCSPEFFDTAQFTEFVDHPMRRGGI